MLSLFLYLKDTVKMNVAIWNESLNEFMYSKRVKWDTKHTSGHPATWMFLFPFSLFSFSLYRCVFHHVAMFSSTPNSTLVAQHFNIFDIYSEYININVNMCVCVLKCMRLHLHPRFHLHHFEWECVHTISSMMHNIAWINEFLSKCREWWKKRKENKRDPYRL